MTKTYLIMLYQKLKEEHIDVQIIRELNYLSDDDIDIILSSKNTQGTINLFQNHYFKSASANVKRKIVALLTDKEVISNILFNAATSQRILMNKYAPEIIEAIANAKGKYQEELAFHVAVIEASYTDEERLELVKILASAEEFQVGNIWNMVRGGEGSNSKLLIEIAKTKEKFQADLISLIAKNIASGKVLELAAIIINAKGDKQARLAKDIALSDNVVVNEATLKLIEIVANLEECHLEYAREVVESKELNSRGLVIPLIKAISLTTNKIKISTAASLLHNQKILESGVIVELTEIIATAKGEDQSDYATGVAENETVLASGLVVELTKIVANAKDENQAYYSSIVATDEQVLASGLAVELTKIVANAKGEEQSHYSSLVATDEQVLASGLAVELIKIVANANGEDQANYAYQAATNSTIIESGLASYLVAIIADAKGKTQALNAYLIASYQKLHDNGLVLELAEIVANLPEKNSDVVYAMITKNISLKIGGANLLRKINRYINGTQEESFWCDFKDNPEEALSILENVDAKEEIYEETTFTRKRNYMLELKRQKQQNNKPQE